MISLLYYIFSVGLSVIVLICAFLILPIVMLFDSSRRVIHEMCRAMTRLFFITPPTWRKEIKGLENIDPKRSYVVVANHQSMVDIIALYYIPLHFKWVSKREVYFSPMFGQYLLVQGNITIDRGNTRGSMEKILVNGKAWLDKGVSIIIFPEGTRSKSGEVGSFKSGAFNLASQAGVDILPVVVDGTKSLFKGKFFFNWGNRLKITVLPAISAEEIAATPQKELIEKVKGEIVTTLKKMREE